MIVNKKSEEMIELSIICGDMSYDKVWMIYLVDEKRVGPGIMNILNNKKTMRMVVCKCVVYFIASIYVFIFIILCMYVFGTVF
jgi:hypothetical protein